MIYAKRECFFCKNGILTLDHKNVEMISRFISYNGKILPRRVTGVCQKHQRMISNAIKRARLIALIPFVKE
ncbi:MAG: 30S ribosomal protein S18 [Mycoplasmataceae bacterium]|nr:30S ribosomal protein S18 [Mycoplasmataceae bacterium]